MTLCAAYQQFLKEKISEGVTEQTLKYYKYNLPKFIEWCVDCLLYTSDAADE